MAKIIEDALVEQTISRMKPNGQLFEIRVVFGNKVVYTGYFDDPVKLLNAMERDIPTFDDCNIYITLNHLNAGCSGRVQFDRFMKNRQTTSDSEIDGYEWLFIDLDPTRPPGTSSTDEQLAMAKAKGNEVFKFMKDQGFNNPLMAYSGNGVHLLYRIKLENSSDNKSLIERTLAVLDMLFSDDNIKVDRANFNPARVIKLYGTLAQKGRNTEKYPHRMSRLVNPDEEIVFNDKQYLQKICNLYPKEESPQRYNNYSPRTFDLDEWLFRNGLQYTVHSFSGGKKYILSECPFNPSHKGKDACIFKLDSGALSFKCFHNSCADKTWRDVRLKYEPTAYEEKINRNDGTIFNRFNRNKPEPKHIVKKEDRPVFFTARDIVNLPEEDLTFIRTGIKEIDRKMRGLAKGNVSLVSGLRGSAKSTLLTQIALNAIDDGNNVGMFSGELSERQFMRWMFQIAAGKGHVQPGRYEGYYNVPKSCQMKIADWLADRFWLYNNYYGNDFGAILEQFDSFVDEKKLDLLILDNLMAFDIRPLAESKFDAQTAFVLRIMSMAKEKNIHIIFVAHPRKSNGFLRLNDVSGSADLANAVDNAFIVHRNNNDFRKLSGEEFHWGNDNPIYDGTNVIEIAKDRDGGTQDVFIPLYYERESKRLKNDFTENKQYGWLGDDFEEVDDMMEIPF